MSFKFLKELKVPHVFTLLTGIIFICSLLTYIIPSGKFERKTERLADRNMELVVPGSYQKIEKHISLKGLVLGDEADGKASPVGLHEFLTAIPRGMEKSADIIFFIFLIGGVLGILRATGVVTAFIHLLLEKFGHSSKILTIVIMTAVAIGGSTLGMGEEFIPLVPIFLLISDRMGYDRIYGMAIVILAAQVGFASATTNPFTLGVAQGIAQLPLNSGWQLRIAFFVVSLSITVIYLLRYGARIKKEPSASLVDDNLNVDQVEVETFTHRHGWILGVGLLIFAAILYAVAKMGWWMADMAGGFILIGLLAAVIGKLTAREASRAFVKGMEEMVVAALVVGFAKGIQVVLSDGMIMDTVIYAATTLLDHAPRILAVQGMFVFQTMLNFIIPSGSGQAMVTMPLMVPISDVLGITRQTAVFAFQCGDGFSNLIIPTSSILMSMLGLARISFEKWLRFIMPLMVQLWIASAVFLTIAVLIGYA